MFVDQDKELPPLPGPNRQVYNLSHSKTKSMSFLSLNKSMEDNITGNSLKNTMQIPSLDPKNMNLSPSKMLYKHTSPSSSLHKHHSSLSLSSSWASKIDVPPPLKLYQLPNSSGGSFVSSNPSNNPSFDSNRSPEFFKQTTYVMVNGLPYPERITFPQKISKKSIDNRNYNNIPYNSLNSQNQSIISAGSGSSMAATPDSSSFSSQFQNLPIQPHERFDTKSMSSPHLSTLLTTHKIGDSLSSPDRSNIFTEFNSSKPNPNEITPLPIVTKSNLPSSTSSNSLSKTNKTLSESPMKSKSSDFGSKLSRGLNLLYKSQTHSAKDKNSTQKESPTNSSSSSSKNEINELTFETCDESNPTTEINKELPPTNSNSIKKNSFANKAISIPSEKQTKTIEDIETHKTVSSGFKVNSVKKLSVDEKSSKSKKTTSPSDSTSPYILSSSSSSGSYQTADSKPANLEQLPVSQPQPPIYPTYSVNFDNSINDNLMDQNIYVDSYIQQEEHLATSGSLNQRKPIVPNNRPRQLSPLVEMESFDDTQIERPALNQFIQYKESSAELVLPKNRHEGPKNTRKFITMPSISDSNSLNSLHSGSSEDLDEALEQMGQPLEVLNHEEIIAHSRKSSYENPYEFMEVIYDDYINNRKISVTYNNEGRVVSRSFTPVTGKDYNTSTKPFIPSKARVISRTFTPRKKVSSIQQPQISPSHQIFNEMNLGDHYSDEVYTNPDFKNDDLNSSKTEEINHKVRTKKKYIENKSNNEIDETVV